MAYNLDTINENHGDISISLDVSVLKNSKDNTAKLEKFLGRSIPDEIESFYNNSNKFILEFYVHNELVSFVQGWSEILSYNQFLFGPNTKNKKKNERHKNFLWRAGEENLPTVEYFP